MELDFTAKNTDHALMLRTREGDLDAFTSLVNKYNRPVVSFASRVLNDPDEAQDVAQKVFVQVYKQCMAYRFESAFSTWLFTIARNFCLNELRRRWRHQLRLDSPNPNGDADAERETPCQNVQHRTEPCPLVRKELVEDVERAVAGLPERQRAVIRLLCEEELSYNEISALQGLSLSATKTLIHRARQAMKLELKRRWRAEDWQLPCAA